MYYSPPHDQVETDGVAKLVLVGVGSLDAEPGDLDAGPRDPERAVTGESTSTEGVTASPLEDTADELADTAVHESDANEDVGGLDITSTDVVERKKKGSTAEARMLVAVRLHVCRGMVGANNAFDREGDHCASCHSPSDSRHETERSRVGKLAVEDGEGGLRRVHGVATRSDEARDGATASLVGGSVDLLVLEVLVRLEMRHGCDVVCRRVVWWRCVGEDSMRCEDGKMGSLKQLVKLELLC